MTEAQTEEYLRLIGKIATYVSFLLLLLALIKFRIFTKKPYVFLLVYFIAGFSLNWFTSWFLTYARANREAMTPFLTKWEIDDTFFVDPFYFLKNFIFMGLFTYYLLSRSSIKKWVAIISGLGIIFTIINSIWGETYKIYQVWGSSFDNVYKVLIGFLIIKWIFNSNLSRKITDIPAYYFAIAFIIIGAIAGLIDALSNAMFGETTILFNQVHILKNVFMIVAFVLLSIGVLKVKSA